MLKAAIHKWIQEKCRKEAETFLEKESGKLLHLLSQALPDKELTVDCDIMVTDLKVEYSGVGMGGGLLLKPDALLLDFSYQLSRKVKTGFGSSVPEVFAILPKGKLDFTLNGSGALEQVNFRKTFAGQGVEISRISFNYRIKTVLTYEDCEKIHE